MSILVTYASAHGSTREIAERIAERLAEQLATKVDCTPMTEVPRLSTIPTRYSAIVMGSAVHAGRWIRPGRAFVRSNAAFLRDKDKHPPAVWAFSVCGAPEEQQTKVAPGYVKWFDRKLGDGTVRAHKMLRGRLEKTDLPWILRIILSCCTPEKENAYGDFRDWDGIDEWANDVAKTMTEAEIVAHALEAPGEQGQEAVVEN